MSKFFFKIFLFAAFLFLAVTPAMAEKGCVNQELQAARRFRVGELLESAAIGDFNRDGKKDVAVLDGYSSAVNVLFGDGDARFGEQRVISVGLNPVAVVAGDFNRDGNTDLITANNGDRSLSILIGNGAGDFQAPIPMLFGDSPSALAVSDLNSDGFDDVVVAFHDLGTIYVLISEGANYLNCQETLTKLGEIRKP